MAALCLKINLQPHHFSLATFPTDFKKLFIPQWFSPFTWKNTTGSNWFSRSNSGPNSNVPSSPAQICPCHALSTTSAPEASHPCPLSSSFSEAEPSLGFPMELLFIPTLPSRSAPWHYLTSIHLLLIQIPGVTIFEVNFSIQSPSPGSSPGCSNSSFFQGACVFSTRFLSQSPVSQALVHAYLCPKVF